PHGEEVAHARRALAEAWIRRARLPAEHAAAMGVTGASDIPRWRWQDMPIFFRAVHWASPHPCLTAYGLTESPNHVLIGLFRLLKWAARAVSCQRAHAGGRGPPWSGAHPTPRVSHGVMARASHGVCPAHEVGSKRTVSSGWSQACSVRSRTVRACVPSQAQAVARRSSRR